ncbi:hypothetical protein MPUL_33990 [Mycolicibacterium pulveris]|uniref:Uncharacterized protein n=1 Tax=Mycolicibacterium pulveris TaxID=36813 RepID=A0A7I7UN20_MYCPV|nr:hypothetical protein MPUL_33990 [Mycolicibacterium pulveris]
MFGCGELAWPPVGPPHSLPLTPGGHKLGLSPVVWESAGADVCAESDAEVGVAADPGEFGTI